MPARGILVNRQRCCEIMGWTRGGFDSRVRDGMPVEQGPATRGGDYRVYTGDVIAWEIRRATGAGARKKDFRSEIVFCRAGDGA